MSNSLTRALDIVQNENFLTIEKPTNVNSMNEAELYDWVGKMTTAKMQILQIENQIETQLAKVRS